MASSLIPRMMRLTLALASVTMLAVVSASAAVFTSVTQSGTFTVDNQKAQYTFTVPTAQTLYFYTTSYAGGLNANGTTAPKGGFDPILSLFDSSGTFLADNDEDPAHYNRLDPTTNAVFDSYLSKPLTAGSYTLVLTQYDNFSAGNLSDGFQQDNTQSYDGTSFTQQFAAQGATGRFYDTSNIPGAQRNGNYTFNISATAPTVGPAAPEPAQTAALGVFGLALGGLILTARRRHAAAK